VEGKSIVGFLMTLSLLFGSRREPSLGVGRPDVVEAFGCELPLD
jgi:hypothetical protein